MIEPESQFTGTINALAYGGKGILRTPEKIVVFVPFTAPGDKIECHITHVKKNYAEGMLLRLIIPSQNRVKAKCPYFGSCGGCQIQHLSYEAQIAHKKQVVEDALNRVYNNVEITVSKANPIWAYRRHVTLTLLKAEKGYTLGYYANDNRSLIEIKECAIFTEKEDSIFTILSALVLELDSCGSAEGKVKLLKTKDNRYILCFHFKILPKNFNLITKKYLSAQIIGIKGNSIKESFAFGITDMDFMIGNLTFKTEPSAFLQVHAELSQEIYQEICNLMRASPSKFTLDLYSGIGISSLLCAPFADSIIGVEMNATAVKLAKINAQKANISHIQFYANSVETILVKLLKQNPDTAIVNPPRTGMNQNVVELLSKSTLKRIIYVSCQPATLARDLQILQKNNFLLTKAQAFDMFPQTGHVETLVCLDKKNY